MSIYAIGDVHGSLGVLTRLLRQIDFRPEHDHLVFVGDLVGRGADSLETLRFITSLDSTAQAVLGNHDLNLLACAAEIATPRPQHKLDAILAAPDRDRLVDWLRYRPLMLAIDGWHIVHAGIPPSWSLAVANRRARDAESILRGAKWRSHLAQWYSADPNNYFGETLDGFTRMRFVNDMGQLDLSYAGGRQNAPQGLRPWFSANRLDPQASIIFGHWAALGLYESNTIYCIDSGCAWGGKLSALRLADRKVFQVDAGRATR